MAVRSQGKRNKERGYEFECETVCLAQQAGMNSFRTWGSDGASRDLPNNVDVVVAETVHIQCKRQKAPVSKRYLPDPNILAQAIRGDRQNSHVVLRTETLMDMLQMLDDAGRLEDLLEKHQYYDELSV